MKINIKYLLWLSEKAGIGEEELEVPDNYTLKDLVNKIAELHSGLREILRNIFSKDNPFIILVNGKRVDENARLRENDKVTLLPPVSGG